MRKFIAGLVLGLMFASVPSRAEWYSEQIEQCLVRLAGIEAMLGRIALAVERMSPRPPAEAVPVKAPGCRNAVGAIVPCR